MDTEFIIHSVGYDVSENTGTLIDRPTGSNDYLFLHFLCDVIIKLSDTAIIVQSGACILYTPDHAQWYTTDNCPLLNSYIHFDGTAMDSFFNHLAIPLNQVFYPHNSSFIEDMLNLLESEVILKDSYWNEAANGILLHFFSRLGRLCSSKESFSGNASKLEMYEKFKSVRFKILHHPEYPWTLNEMAELTTLCVSRFSIYYKEFFGISPKLDLISSRINRGKTLLTNEALTVSEVSEQLGYNNVFHFIRQFKTYTGYSPGKWKFKQDR